MAEFSNEDKIKAAKAAMEAVRQSGTTEQRDRLQQGLRKLQNEIGTTQMRPESLAAGQQLMKDGPANSNILVPGQREIINNKQIVRQTSEDAFRAKQAALAAKSDAKQLARLEELKKLSYQAVQPKTDSVYMPGNATRSAIGDSVAGATSVVSKLGRGLKTVVPGATFGAALMGSGDTSAGEALVEELMPDIMVPTETGPTKQTEGYGLERGIMPEELKLSGEELEARKKALEAMRGN